MMAICFSHLSIYSVAHPWLLTLRPPMFFLPETIVLALHLNCYYVISAWSRESNVSNLDRGYSSQREARRAHLLLISSLSLSFFFGLKSLHFSAIVKKIAAECNKFNHLFLETRVLLFISTLTTRCSLSSVKVYFFICFFRG